MPKWAMAAFSGSVRVMFATVAGPELSVTSEPLLTSPEEYTYLGLIKAGQNEVFPTKKSVYKKDSGPMAALNFLFKQAARPAFPPNFVVRHDGRCGRCGRQLTVPSSIDKGIGPECATKMG